MKKRVGSIVVLTYTQWSGPLPQEGDWLKTTTGRLYEIVSVAGKRMECRVLDNLTERPFGTTLYHWYWNPRKAPTR